MPFILVREKGIEYKCLFDEEDKEFVLAHKWYSDEGYVKRSSDSKRMHRLLMNAKKGEIIDHINHDTRDNRKFINFAF